MKKLFLFFLGFFCFQWMAAQGFYVKKLEVDIHIHSEGYFDVIEQYDVYFTQRKHGIFRNIQTKYDLVSAEGESEKRRIELSRIKVPGHEFSVEPSFIRKFQDEIEVKIGDQNTWITGDKSYEIRYRVKNAFLFEENHTQFYWNIKTAGWATAFDEVNFRIFPPEKVEVGRNDFFVYSGRTGGTDQSEDFEITYEDHAFVGRSLPYFKSKSGENITVLLKLPPDSIEEHKPLWPFWTHYGWTIFLGGFIAYFFAIWNIYGKDEKVLTNISYFPPDNIHPSMAGFLIDDKADTQDLIALIPYWGSKGILRLEQIPKSGMFSKEDTRLIKLQSLPSNAPSYEREFFEGLFSSDSETENTVLVSSLKDHFYKTMNSAKKNLKYEAQIYYDLAAHKMKNKTIAIVLAGGLMMGGIFLFTWGLIAAVAVLPVMIILLILSPILEKKNSKGNELLSDLRGFKQFIKVAEEHKLKMLLEQEPNYFEDTMAYAVAFGLFSQWAKKFEHLNVQPPNWYSSPVGIVTMSSFSNSFAGSIRSTQQTMVSSPSSSSSGGGSSGGGFGGGGGGSW